MPTARQRLAANLWAMGYAARLLWRYRGRIRQVAHHINVEHAHLTDQAAAASFDAAGDRSGERTRAQRQPES
jgi:hypothetical protein